MKLEREAVYALLTRGAQGATMLSAAACVAWRFSPGQQGLFFVFLSLGALIQVSEFGLSYAVLQVAARLRGEATQLADFRRHARRLQFALLTAAVLLVGALGAAIFASRAGEADWAGPWLAFVAAVAVAQWFALHITFVEATGSATAAWRLRMLQEGIGGGAFIAALLAGAGLWALAWYWAVRAGVAAAGLVLQSPGPTGEAPASSRFHWRPDVWPFQWRVGLSSAMGFLIFQAVNPIVLVEQGSEAAGRLGLAFAVMTMALQVSSAWPLSQAARFSRLIHTGDFVELRQRFGNVLAGSTALAGLIAGAVLLGQLMLSATSFSIAARLPQLLPLAALLAAGLGHHVTACLAVLLRAEQREPLLRVTVFGGLFTLGVTWLAASSGDTVDVAVAHLACTLLGLTIAVVHYRRFALRVFMGARAATSGPP